MLKGVGIYIGRNEVIAVSAIRTSSGPRVKAFASEPIQIEAPPQDQDEEGKTNSKSKTTTPEAQAIRRVLEKIKEKGAYVTAAVSPSLVATRHFIMPAVPKGDEIGAIRHEATRYIPFRLADSIMDYHAQTNLKNVSSVTVTAIRKDVLQVGLEDLRLGSAKVLMIEPVYCAVGRAFSALRMLASAKTQGFVVLQSDGNVHVTFASGGIVYLSRDFLLSWNSDEDKSRFTDELKASIDFFFKLTGGEVLTQIFLAGAGDLKLWAEHLEHAFNYTIRFDCASFPDEKKIPPEALHSALVAFGLALRPLNYASPLGEIKLLPKEDRCAEPLKKMTFLGVECVAIFILFVLVRLVIFQPMLKQLENENAGILESANRDYPELASRSIEDLTSQSNALRPRLERLNKFIKYRGRPSSVLTSLGKGLPLSIALESISVDEKNAEGGKKINIKGLCFVGSAEKETNVVSAWVKALAANKVLSALFPEIKLDEVSREKKQDMAMTRFSVVGE